MTYMLEAQLTFPHHTSPVRVFWRTVLHRMRLGVLVRNCMVYPLGQVGYTLEQ